MRITNKEMKELLENARIGIENSLKNPDVLDKVKEFAVTADSLSKAQELLRKTESFYMIKGPRLGQKISMSFQVRGKVYRIKKSFIVYVKMIRTDLKRDPGFFSEFNLSGTRDTSLSGKIKEPKTFYQNCLDNAKIGNYVIKYGLTREKIESHLAEIADAEKELEKRASMIKDAEQTTQQRNDVFRELSDWWTNYRRILVHVFQDDRQRLEEFNITAYSEGYKPNKKKKPDGEEKEKENPDKSDNTTPKG
jgi:hypothetical protein